MTVRDHYVAKLEEENDILREKVIRLESELGMRALTPLVFGLTGQEGRLFGMLMKREVVNRHAAMDALYGDRPDGDEADIKIVDVYICKIRKKLERFEIAIELVRGQVYRMTGEAKVAASRYLAAQREVSGANGHLS